MFSKATRLLGLAMCAWLATSGLLSAQGTTFSVNLASIAETTIGLDDDCRRRLIPSNLLSGNFDEDGDGRTAPDSLFRIVVLDGDTTNGPVIDGCGTFRWEVTNADPRRLLGFRFGNGRITARDETPPTLFAAGVPSPLPRFTRDLADLTIGNLPPSISRSFRVMGSTTMPDIGSINPTLLRFLIRGGTIPRFADNCSDISVTVSDEIIRRGNCNDIILRRTFSAMDFNPECSGNPNGSGTITTSYDIVLTRPRGAAVQPPVSVVNFDCDDPAVTDLEPGQNPAPRTQDLPFLNGPAGPIFLSGTFGNVAVTFTDSERILTCNNTYKVVRTYTVVDWCAPDNVRSFTQVVKVGDFSAPTITAPTQDLNFDGQADAGPLRFSTNTADCGARINTATGGLALTDGCSGVSPANLTAFVLLDGDTSRLVGPIQPLAPNPVDRISGFVPAGRHVLQYRAVDNCGNLAVEEVDILVEDRSGPVVIVEDALNVSLSNTGFATVTALELDEGSYDDCTGILLEIAFANPVALAPIGAFGPSITLTCMDVGSIPVIVRATDENGNTNSRMSTLNVVDNAAPVCIAPASLALNCTEAGTLLPEDISAFINGDPSGTVVLLDSLFGRVVSTDNCGNEVTEQMITADINDCGTGNITRVFSVTDSRGFTSAPGCRQVINIQGIRDYTISYPGDASASCGNDPAIGDVVVTENSCDMVLVNTHVDTFFTESDESACYKLRITYDVINWCEYDGESGFRTVPRDADGDGDLSERTFLHLIPGASNGPQDDTAVLDRDANRRNSNSIRPLDPEYGTSARRGAFRYYQFVKVFDNVAPTITNIDSRSSSNGDCSGGSIEIDFTVADNCSPRGLGSTVEFDRDYVPGRFATTSVLTEEEVTQDGNGNFTALLDNLPAGEHALRVRATDGCGNGNARIIPFSIEADGGVPTPNCIASLTFVLMNDGEGGGVGSIEGDDFVAFVTGNCGDQEISYSVYRTEEEAQQPGFEPRPGRPNFLVSCDDVGEIPLQVYTFNPAGAGTFCAVTAIVQPFDSLICDDGGLGSLAGFITNPDRELLSGIDVYLSDAGDMADMMPTDNNGSFLFTGLRTGEEYMVRPRMPRHIDLSQVRTSDIIRLMQHILGTRPLSDPYRRLAGDANGDGWLDVLDMVAIRRAIIGMDDSFAGGPAWRFVRSDYSLDELGENWNPAELPDYYSVAELSGHNREADFVAVRIGDILTDGRGRGSSVLDITDAELRAGQSETLYIAANELSGFQATLEARPGLTLLGWSSPLLTAGHVNDTRLAEGLLALSYDQTQALGGANWLSLRVRAERDLTVSDYLRLSDRVAVSEGYAPSGSTLSIELGFTPPPGGAGTTRLHQNFPNPVAATTTITFDLEQDGPATLLVHDVAGRQLLQRDLAGFRGRNAVTLSTNADLNNATGVLTYTLVVNGQRRSKRMTVVAR